MRELEDKVKVLQSENKRITNQMLYYRSESVKTKDLLLAHRDCSVTRELNKGKEYSPRRARHLTNKTLFSISAEVIAVVDSSTHMKEVVRVDSSTAEVIEVCTRGHAPQVPITVRRASASKASSLTPLVIVRQTSRDGNGVLRFGGSSDTVIVENVQRPSTD